MSFLTPFQPRYTIDPQKALRVFEQQQLQIHELQKVVQQLHNDFHLSKAKQMNDEHSNKLIDGLTQITSATFDKANAYTHLIIFAGYGSFFALWSLTKSELAPIPSTIAAILMLISVATFAFFEVYRMAYTSIEMKELIGLLENPDGQYSAAVMVERMNKYQTRARQLNLSFYKLWEVILLVCVSTGGLAVVILLGTLFHYLILLLAKSL
jgi:hypothetical protein